MFPLWQIANSTLIAAVVSGVVLMIWRNRSRMSLTRDVVVPVLLVGLSVLIWRSVGNVAQLNDDPIVSEGMAYYSKVSVCTRVDPYRLNYGSPYPVCKSSRDYFRQNGVRAIDIGLNQVSIRGAEQTTVNTLAHVLRVLTYWFKVQERACAGMRLRRGDHPDADQRGFISQPVDKRSMRDTHKVLIGARTKIDLLLPAIILAHDQGSDPRFDQAVNNQAGAAMQRCSKTTVAVISHRLKLR